MSRRSWRLSFWVIALLASCVEGPSRVSAVPVLGESGTGVWLMVTVGKSHSCALDSNRTAYCWGSNSNGQLGIIDAADNCGSVEDRSPCAMAPVRVSAGARFLMVSAGGMHSCAIGLDRAPYCWGSNDVGQLGDDLAAGAYPVRARYPAEFTSISAGYNHSCGITVDRELVCWGSNEYGQLAAAPSTSMPPARVGLADVVEVSAGQDRTCARVVNGTTLCWGKMWQYREGSFEYSRSAASPELVPGAPAFTGLSVGVLSTCAHDATGFAYCWEANPNGQLGTGTAEGSATPLRVASTLEFAQVSAGSLQSCAVTVSGVAYCWGDNTFGQLGVGVLPVTERCGHQGLTCITRPTPVFGRHAWIQVVTGFGNHTCGVTSRQNIYCWGLGSTGQRGDGTRNYRELVPTLIASAR